METQAGAQARIDIEAQQCCLVGLKMQSTGTGGKNWGNAQVTRIDTIKMKIEAM
jgi:hypothetical protein